MLRNMNPFKGIIGPQYERHALTLNTTYMQKVGNTFTVLNGSTLYSRQDYHKAWEKLTRDTRDRYGILDFIPFLGADILLSRISKFSFKLKGASRRLPGIIKLLLAIPFIILNVAIAVTRLAMHAIRFVVALALTAAAAITIVPVVHGFASWAYNNLMKLVDSMKVESNTQDTAVIHGHEIRSGIGNQEIYLKHNSENQFTTLMLYKGLQLAKLTAEVIHATNESDPNTRGMNALLQLDQDSIASKVERNISFGFTDSQGLEDGKPRWSFDV